MTSVRRSSSLALAGLLAVGALSMTACSSGSGAAGAVTAAAASAVDSAVNKQVDDAIGGDSAIKTQICDAFKSNADSAYDTAIKAINAKQAGAGDILSKAVSAEKFKGWLSENCK